MDVFSLRESILPCWNSMLHFAGYSPQDTLGTVLNFTFLLNILNILLCAQDEQNAN